MSKKLILIGAGEFAEIAYEYFTHDSDYEVVAFSVERQYIEVTTLYGLPVVAYEELDVLYSPDQYELFVAIPVTQLNRLRTRLYLDAKNKSYRFATYISSQAFVWHNAKVGENTFIFENNVIQPFVTIGNNCVLWSGNHIGHRTVIKDNVFVASHSVISGYCQIGESCFIGVNSTIADNVIVGRDCVIGAGALISKNTDQGKIYPGISAEAAKVGSLRFYKVKE